MEQRQRRRQHWPQPQPQQQQQQARTSEKVPVERLSWWLVAVALYRLKPETPSEFLLASKSCSQRQ